MKAMRAIKKFPEKGQTWIDLLDGESWIVLSVAYRGNVIEKFPYIHVRIKDYPPSLTKVEVYPLSIFIKRFQLRPKQTLIGSFVVRKRYYE